MRSTYVFPPKSEYFAGDYFRIHLSTAFSKKTNGNVIIWRHGRQQPIDPALNTTAKTSYRK